MFEKKFKVRISHFAKDYFTVDYSYHRFFPIYSSILYWFECGYDNNLASWSTELFKLKNAEEFAEKLKSIEDVNEYYKKENIKEKEFWIKRKDYIQKTVPYKSKQIR